MNTNSTHKVQASFYSSKSSAIFPLLLFLTIPLLLTPGLLAQAVERGSGETDGSPPRISRVIVSGSFMDEVTILGSGFAPEPEDNSVYLLEGTAGAFLEVLESSPDRLVCRLKPYASAVEGSIQLRTGDGVAFPATMHRFEGRAYLAANAQWSVAHQATTGPSLTLSEPSVHNAISSQLVGDTFYFPLDVLDGTSSGRELEIHHIVEFGGHPIRDPLKPEGTDRQQEAQWLGVAGSLHLTLLTATPASIDAETLAADLASILNATYGSLGLKAEAVGRELTFNYTLGISNGFAQLSY